MSDYNFNIPSEISILLGVDIYFNSLSNGCIKLLNGSVLQNTVFGYVVAGTFGPYKSREVCHNNLLSNLVICDEMKLENVMEKFW